MTDSEPRERLNPLFDRRHPKRSPLLGLLLSKTLCLLGHRVGVLNLDAWDEPWLGCGVCGARFMPAAALGGDTDTEGESDG